MAIAASLARHGVHLHAIFDPYTKNVGTKEGYVEPSKVLPLATITRGRNAYVIGTKDEPAKQSA
jgi:hypothetical protein